jgi:hypothetical protein
MLDSDPLLSFACVISFPTPLSVSLLRIYPKMVGQRWRVDDKELSHVRLCVLTLFGVVVLAWLAPKPGGEGCYNNILEEYRRMARCVQDRSQPREVRRKYADRMIGGMAVAQAVKCRVLSENKQMRQMLRLAQNSRAL